MKCLVRSTKRLSSLLVVASLSVGCGSAGGPYREQTVIPAEQAQIVVFRPDMFFQGGIPYQVSVNGTAAAVLRNGGFVVIDAKPGEALVEIRSANTLQALFRNPTLGISAAPNKRVFVRATPERGNTAVLEIIPTGEALAELKTLRESY